MNDKERREKAIDRVAAKKVTPSLEWSRRTVPDYLQLEVMIEEGLLKQEEEDAQ